MALKSNELNNYDGFFEKANEKQRHHPDELIVVCSLEDFKENLGGYYGHVNIFNNIIYLHPESSVHVKARITISIDIKSSLPKNIRELYNNISSLVPIFNRYACGSIQYKYPDFNFFKGYDFKNLTLVGEIIFRHETEEQLLLESIHYPTEYTSIKLVIIVQLPRHKSEGFNMRLILIQRELEFQPKKKEVLESALNSGERKMEKCIKLDCPINVSDWKNNQAYPSMFNVKLLNVIEYTNVNFGMKQPIKFYLPGSIFDHSEPIQITINFSTIEGIKIEWEEYTSEFN